MLYLFHHLLFFLNGTATTEIYTYLNTLSLHDALPISRSGDMGALGALLAADVGMWSDGGGKRPAAMEPVLGYDIVLKLHRSLAVLFGKYGSTLVHTGMINGLPGFVTREADGEMQTTEPDIEEDRKSVLKGKSVSVRVDLGGRRIS